MSVVTSRKKAGDAADRKRLEAEHPRMPKMDLGELAGGIAHDINNLLSAIIGGARLIRRNLQPLDPLRLDAAEIEQVAQHAVALTRQLAAYSQKGGVQPRRVDLNKSLLDMTGMLQRVIGDQIRLRTDLATDLPSVWADPSQVHQILLNLVVNARDAMPAGGDIRIATATRDATREGRAQIPSGDWVVLSVTDTGVGIDDAVKARLFEPFFTTKAPGKGTGLGLATVFGIVQQNRGHISVDSRPGHGAAFHVFLPVHGERAVRGR